MKDYVTLHDLMGEDYYAYVHNNPKFGFDVGFVSDEVDQDIIMEGVHPDAMDSFAVLCKRFITAYNRCNNEKLSTNAVDNTVGKL